MYHKNLVLGLFPLVLAVLLAGCEPESGPLEAADFVDEIGATLWKVTKWEGFPEDIKTEKDEARVGDNPLISENLDALADAKWQYTGSPHHTGRLRYYAYDEAVPGSLIKMALENGAFSIPWHQLFSKDTIAGWQSGADGENPHIRADVALYELEGKDTEEAGSETKQAAYLLMQDSGRVLEIINTQFMGAYGGSTIGPTEEDMFNSLVFFATETGFYQVEITINKVYVDEKDSVVVRQLDRKTIWFNVVKP
jgi:hypothetical protein